MPMVFAVTVVVTHFQNLVALKFYYHRFPYSTLRSSMTRSSVFIHYYNM